MLEEPVRIQSASLAKILKERIDVFPINILDEFF